MARRPGEARVQKGSLPPEQRWYLLDLGQRGSRLLEVRDSLRLETGARVQIVEGRLEVHPGDAPAQLNDVEVKGAVSLRHGDVFTQGGHSYLSLPASRELTRPQSRLDHSAFMMRLEEEVGARDEVTLLLLRSAALREWPLDVLLPRIETTIGFRFPFAQPTPDLGELLVPSRAATRSEAMKHALTSAVGTTGETVQWGTATSPADGATAEELWSLAVDRLIGLETPASHDMRFADPSMIRLWNLAEAIARARNTLVLVGEPGVGRETFARHLRELGTATAPFIVHSAGRFEKRRWDDDVARANGGALHIRHPEILPEQERAAFFAARRFLPSASFAPGADRPHQGSEVFLPSLHDRPADAVPIAEYVLNRVDTRLGRRRSTIRADARQGLSTLLGKENARSLRNGVVRAALGLTGSEMRAEHLEESRIAVAASTENLRQQLRDTERRTLEEALRQTGWNVSAASRLMDLPRRTIVYRMRRLGIRRPAAKP